MKKNFLHRVLPVALSMGFFVAMPAFVPTDSTDSRIMQTVEAAGNISWDFSKDAAGWKYGGIWAYTGEPLIALDSAFGGSLKVDVDFTPHVNDSWSEIKIEDGTAAAKPLDISGCNVLTFDLYYNPQAMTTGSLKTKLYAKATNEQEVINVCPDIDLSQSKQAANGLKVVRVRVPFTESTAKIKYFCLSLVGSNTDYKGVFYLNHLKLGQEKVADGYVEKTAVAVGKPAVSLEKLAIPVAVSLADGQAGEKTARLYAYLTGIAASDQVLYGHQNEMHKKVSSLGGPSDTYDMVKDYAAMVGVDGLALTGNELSLSDAEKAAGLTLTDKLTKISLAASHNGSVLTMSCHMPNFAEVAKRPKIAGKYDYSGYSPNVTSGDVVKRILPGGDLNAVYQGYLDMIADYAGRLQAADVPLIFRPFHENNGSWFWWGAAYCTPSQYKNLFRYTEEYLRDVKGLHNLLYAYSPGGPFSDEEDYLMRYPGDAYIDVIGFDMYHRNPAEADGWMESFGDTMKLVQSFASQHHKLAAVTETGILVGKSAMAKTGNQRQDWFREVLHQIAPKNMAYFMTWSNFDETNFDQPYMVTEKRGHEMINSFIDFYNQPQAVFARQMPDYSRLAVRREAAMRSAGYMTAPDSLARICSPTMLRAKTAGAAANVQFLLKKKDGTVVASLPGKSAGKDLYTAEISQELLRSMGAAIGSAELQLNGQTTDALPLLFNMAAPPQDTALVDDFENYYGDNGLLQSAYSTNCGAGCEVVPVLSTSEQKAKGESGLAFHYKINKGGYAGIVKSLKGADWSDRQAVQFWIAPDGKGNKLIIQLNSNGEDFEVDLTQLSKTTGRQVVTLPFSKFHGKNGGVFNKASVQHFAIYCNTIGDATVDSVIYFDDIRAVK